MAHLRSVGESTASPHDRYVTYTKLRCPTCDLRYLAVDDSEWGCESFCVYRQTARAAGLGRRRLASLLKALPAELDSTKKRARLYAARSLAEHYLHTGALAPLEALLVHARKDVRREALETCWRGSGAEPQGACLTTLLDLLRSEHATLRRQVVAHLRRQAPFLRAHVPRLVAHLGSRRIDDAELSVLRHVADATSPPPDLTAANAQLVAYAARPGVPASRRKQALELLRDCLDRSYDRARSLREALSESTDPALQRLHRQLDAWIEGGFPPPPSEPVEDWPPR